MGGLFLGLLVPVAGAEELTDAWPRWRGTDGSGVWHPPRNTRIDLADGLTEVWQEPIAPGYSGIAVQDGRVYTQDRPDDPPGQERVVCLDAFTGRQLWEHRYEADYADLDYSKGPRATPLVDDGLVYTLGAVGQLCCLDASTGDLVWQHDLKRDFAARQPLWGFAASPIRHGETIIVHPGAGDGCFMAFQRRTGQLVWKSGEDSCGYATPIVIQRRGHELLIGWTPEHIVGLSPQTGAEYWRVPYPVTYGVSIATPIYRQGIVLVSGYWEGTKAIRLGDEPESAELIWEENRQLRGLMSEPLYREGHVYLLDKRYGIVCFELESGNILWNDENQLTPEGRNPQASLVWIGDSNQILALNSDGQLVHARFRPEGYQELGRTPIVGETWAHPAYAGPYVFARDDERIVCVRLVP
jgi:outer membrane protein assembly factor BamB